MCTFLLSRKSSQRIITTIMTWDKILDFYRGLLFITCLNSFQIITGVEWNVDYKSAYFKLLPIPNSISINESLVSDEKTANAVTSCALVCFTRLSNSLYYRHSDNTCYCNSEIDSRLNVDTQSEDVSSDIVYGYISSSVQALTNYTYRKFDIQPYKEDCIALYHHGYIKDAFYTVQPLGGSSKDIFCKMDDVSADDCLQWLQYGYMKDGVYKIRLSNGTTTDVWCDQQGGGWTVIQHREDGSVDFLRTWTEYVNGFGNISGEYWLGLEAIYLLPQQSSSLRIEMETFGDVTPPTAYALYTEFALHPATDKYRLSIGTFSGDRGDSFAFQNNMQFSTPDSDNDLENTRNCAIDFHGAWWYNCCHESNLNGKYHGGFHNNSFATGMNWYFCWGFTYSIKSCSMKVKRISAN